jgi:hypothetical protein
VSAVNAETLKRTNLPMSPEKHMKATLKGSHRQGIKDAALINCKLCQEHGPPVWHEAAGAYFHVDSLGRYSGCGSEHIYMYLDERDQ